jgi:N-acetylneuraminic acid mutarotase
MAEKRILKENGVDILPITHESAVLTKEGTTIDKKYATKKEVNTQIQEESSKVNARVDAVDAKVGDLSTLQTANKSTITEAINELFQRGNSVKQKLVDTLIAKDVEASTNETFESLLNKFNEVEFTSDLPASGEGDVLYPIADLPYASCHGGACSDGKRYVYYIGGSDTSNDSAVSNCYRYDSKTNIWESIESVPYARAMPGVTFCNGKIYCIAGSSTSELRQGTNTNYVYDPATNTWSSKAVMPSSLTWGSCTSYGNIVYYIGGDVSGSATKTNYCYDTITNTWTIKRSMTTSLIGSAITSSKEGYIDVLGGYSDRLYTQNFHYQYDIASDLWSTKTGLAQSLALHDCGCVLDSYNNSEIYLFSGCTKSTSTSYYRNRIYKYNISADTYTQCTDFSPSTTEEGVLLRYKCAVLDNKIYILGGTLDTIPVNTCQVYIPY